MLWIFEAELIGDFTDGQTGFYEQLLRTLNDGILNVTLGGSAALLANQVAKVVGREAGLVGEVSHSGQTVSFRMTALEVLAQLLMEGGEDVAVHFVARDELTVVVAHAVVQQQTDGIGDERLRVAVDGVLQLLFDSVEQFHYHVLLALREVQGLALVVVEERVVVDAAGELRAVEQVGMEQ